MAGHRFFGPVPPDHLPSLAAAARMLIDVFLRTEPERLRQAREDFDLFAGDIRPDPAVDAAKLAAALEAVLVRDAPEGAMIAQTIAAPEHRPTGNALTAWVLAAALRRRRLTPTQSGITEGLHAMRRLKARAPEALAALTPLATTMPAVAAQTRTLLQSGHLAKTPAGYLERIEYLLRSAVEEGAEIHREHPGEVPLTVVLREDGQIGLTGGGRIEDEEVAGPADLQVADRPAEAHAVIAPDDPGNLAPHAVATARAASVARAAARRALALPAEMDPLTPHELRTLRGACCSGAARVPALRSLLASLAFGTAFGRLGQQGGPRWVHRDGLWGLELEVALPPFIPLIEPDAGPEPAERLFLVAPPDLQGPAPGPVDRSAITEVLAGLRPDLARPLTLGRIARFKGDWLRRAGADLAVSGFLLGTAPDVRSQLHYARVPKAMLTDWHRGYLELGLGLDGSAQPRDPGVYGTRRDLPPRAFQLAFEEQRAVVRAARVEAPATTAGLAGLHNAFTVYTLMLLYLASGHRPVGQPFERLADFERQTGLLWISDKTGRGGRGTRMIVLPPSALRQIDHWHDHLTRLAARLNWRDRSLVTDRIAPALSLASDARPLFFLLGPDGRPRELSADEQKAAFKSVLATPLNWSRHILRSALIGQVPGPALDAWLGHAHQGEEGFRPASGLGLRDLRDIADRIEVILAAHGAMPLESPL